MIKTIRHQDVIIFKDRQNYHCTRLSIICTLKNNSNPRKTNPTQKTPNTAHCRQSVNQTAQRAENAIEHTVPDKNRSGALNAMRSTRRETTDTREVERATRDKTETLQTGSRARNARRNGNGTDEKSSEQCATERKRDVQESERKTRNTTKRDGGKERAGGTMLADRSKISTRQPSRNSRTNLSHTLGRKREATARQSNIVRNGSVTTNLTTN